MAADSDLITTVIPGLKLPYVKMIPVSFTQGNVQILNEEKERTDIRSAFCINGYKGSRYWDCCFMALSVLSVMHK